MTLKDNPVIEFIARTGYITKGIVYFTVGVIMVRTSFGLGGEAVNSKQVLEMYSQQRFGFILLSLAGLGLLAHAIWRIIQGTLDPENRDGGAKSILFRSVDVLTGFLYLGLSYAALQILMGKGTSSSEESTQIWVSRVLDLPFGEYLVFILAGICVIGGGYQFYSAVTASFDYSFDFKEMSKPQKKLLRTLGRVGISAWGIVYCMVSFLLYQAALYHDAEQAGGMEKALLTLAEQPYGIWVLGVTSIGLLTYGVYLLILSRFHKIYGDGFSF